MGESFRDELVNGIRNGFCTILATQANYYGFIGDVFPWLPAGYTAELMRMAYRLACNREPPDAPTADFTGGQCFTPYTWQGTRISRRYDGLSPSDIVFTRGNVYGRIGAVEVFEEPGTFGNDWRSRIPSTDASGVTTYTDLGTEPASTNIKTVWQNITVTRQDGLPDNCGNPPAPTPTPEPGYNSPLIVVNYTDNSSNDVNLNTRFTFLQPIVKIDGTIRVPLRVDVGDIGVNIRGDINLNTGDININFGNQNYNPSNEPNPDAYDSPDDIPDVPPDVPTPVIPPSPNNPDPDTTTIIRACIVTVSSIGDEQSIIYQNANPDIYVPNLGFVQFLIAVNNRLAWTSDIPVKNTRNFIPCPWLGGALAVRGTPRVGVAWTISPVYDKAEVSIPAS